MRKILFLLLFLQGCSWGNDFIWPRFPNSGDFVNRFPLNKQGVVILRLNSRYPSTRWCKYARKSDITSGDCFDLAAVDYYQILMLENGFYEIRGFEKATRLYAKAALDPKFSQKTKRRKTKAKLFFQVKEGKVSFLGEIDFRGLKASSKTSNEEDFARIKKSFAKQDLKDLRKIFRGNKPEAEILMHELKDLGEGALIKDSARSGRIFTNKK